MGLDGRSRRAFVGSVVGVAGLLGGCLTGRSAETPGDRDASPTPTTRPPETPPGDREGAADAGTGPADRQPTAGPPGSPTRTLADLRDRDNWAGWEPWGGETTVDDDAAASGRRSLRVAAGTDADRAATRYRFTTPQDFSGRFPAVAFRWDLDGSTGGDVGGRGCGVRLVDDAGRSAIYYQFFHRWFVRSGHWQRVAPTYRPDVSDPEFDYRNVVEVGIYHFTGGEYPATFWIDRVGAPRTRRDRGAVMVHFDDSSPSVYETAFPLMERRGIPGTFNVISRRIGPGETPSPADLREMAGAGWTVSAHPQYDKPLPEMRAAEARAAMEREVTFLSEHGFTPSVLAWPYDTWDARTVEIASQYFDLGFVGGSGPHAVPPAAGTDLLYPRVGGDVARKRVALERAIARDGLVCLTFHGVGGEDVSRPAFEALLERIASAPVDALTAADLLDERARTDAATAAPSGGADGRR